MRISLKFIFVSIILINYSCDPMYFAEIKNNKEENVKIQIGFDKERLKETWGNNKSYTDFLKSYPNSTNVPPAIDFDTVNLTKTYQIGSGESFPLSWGSGFKPDLLLFKYLLIFDSDSTMIENEEQLKKAFNKKKGGHWIMEID